MRKLDIIVDNDTVKWIPGYENMYAARIDGIIISYKNINKPKIIKASKNEKGYMKINLSINPNNIKTQKIHRLIALTFIYNSEPETDTSIDHIDMNKENNSYTNLRWCTHHKNIQYYNKNKYGENWKPKPIRTREEIEQRKIDIAKMKQERINARPYGSAEEMIKQTGKPIVVNDIKYISCGEAASAIVDEELLELGNIRKKTTVSKELRKFLKSDKVNMTMYVGRYKISRTA